MSEAKIDKGNVVIRIPPSALQKIIDGAWRAGGIGTRFKVTDPSVFARALVAALNAEDEQGSTPLHRLLDECIEAAVDDGAEGIEVHKRQDD